MVEGCERFCYSGLKVILLFYFMHFFHTDRNTATVYYHSFSCACHLTPIFGAILSDGYIGRYWTILLLSIVYFIGASTLAVTAIPQLFHRQSYVHCMMHRLIEKGFFLELERLLVYY